MNEDFVRKDIYEFDKKIFDAKLERVIERIELKMDAHMARVDGTIAEMRGELKAMDAKINNVSRNVALIMTIIGLVISGISIYFSMR